MNEVVCPGCGLALPATGSAVERPGVRASAECLDLAGEVVAYGMQHVQVLGAWHQTCVDAYLLQHVDVSTKPITLCFALNGLYLVLERGWTGLAAREAHQRLAETVPRGDWPSHEQPRDVGTMTVLHPAMASTPTEQAEAVERWGAIVWQAWAHTHQVTRDMTDRQLAGWQPRTRPKRRA